MAKVEDGSIESFRPQRRNLNVHSQRGMGALEASMRKHGYVAPMTAAADGEIIDGSARLETVANVFEDDVLIVHHDGTRPVVMVRDDIPDATTNEARAISALANRVAEINLTWDAEELLADLQSGVDFGNAFNQDELDALLAGLVAPNKTVKDDGPQIDRAEELRQIWSTELGQKWQLGNHRLICGDCTDSVVVDRLFGGEKPNGIITDPPYAFGLSSTSELAAKSGGWHDMMNNSSWFRDLYKQWQEMIADGPLWVFSNWRTLPILMRATVDAKCGIDSVMVWYKDWIGPGGPKGLRPTYELISFTALGNYAIKDRGVEDFIKVGWSSHKPSGHKAEKPAELIEQLIDISNVTILFEPFSGSGTTIIAGESKGVKVFASELSPAYVAVALQRFQDATNITPILLS